MNPMTTQGLAGPPASLPPRPDTTAPTPHRAADTAAGPAGADRRRAVAVADDRREANPPTVTMPQRMRIEVEWHAASLGYVHRILDPETGQQISQLPAAQVLALVDDLMKQIAKG